MATLETMREQFLEPNHITMNAVPSSDFVVPPLHSWSNRLTEPLQTARHRRSLLVPRRAVGRKRCVFLRTRPDSGRGAARALQHLEPYTLHFETLVCNTTFAGW